MRKYDQTLTVRSNLGTIIGQAPHHDMAQHIDFMLSKIPLGRFGTVEEIAALVAWLCTEDCSFSTGAVFDLLGGRATY